MRCLSLIIAKFISPTSIIGRERGREEEEGVGIKGEEEGMTTLCDVEISVWSALFLFSFLLSFLFLFISIPILI